MNYDFDTFVPRRGTDCEKWDSPEDGVLPLWVAEKVYHPERRYAWMEASHV